MKKWFLAKSLAVKIAVSALAVAVVAEVAVGTVWTVKKINEKNSEVTTGEAVSFAEAPALEQQDNDLEVVEVPVIEEVVAEIPVLEEEEYVAENIAYVKNSTSLENGDFSNGLDAWDIYSYVEDNISYTADGVLKITMGQTGTQDWHVQAKQGGIKLEKGKWYSISLDAKSTLNRSILVAIQRDGMLHNDDWTPYANAKELSLSSSWKTFTYVFQMTENTDAASVFMLSLGAVNGRQITTEHTVSIDNVKLTKLSDTWMDSLREGDNLIANPTFAYESLLWEPSVVAPGAATVSFANNKASFDISEPGTVDWHVQLKQGGIKLENNTGYRMTFTVSSNVARTIKLGFMDTNYVNWYGGADIVLNGTENQQITVDFYNTLGANENALLMLSMGKIEGVGTPAGKIEFSNFRLVKCDSVTPPSDGNQVVSTPSYPDLTYNVGDEILRNGGAISADTWSGYVDSTNSNASGSISIADGKIVAVVGNAGTNSWDVQVKQEGIKVEKGCTYTVTMNITSTVEREVKVDFLHPDTYEWIGGETLLVGPEVRRSRALHAKANTNEYEFNVTVNGETEKRAIIAISMGKMDGDTPASTIVISKVSVKKSEETPKADNTVVETVLYESTTGVAAPDWGANLNVIDTLMKNAITEGKIKIGTVLSFNVEKSADDYLAMAVINNDWVSIIDGSKDVEGTDQKRTDLALNSAGKLPSITLTKEMLDRIMADGIYLNGHGYKLLSVTYSGGTGNYTVPAAKEELPSGWAVNGGAHVNGYTVESGVVNIEIKDTGSNAWDVQLSNNSVSLTKDKTYKISYDMKSTVARSAIVLLQQNGGTYATYSDTGYTESLTTAWQSFNHTFTMTKDTDASAVWNFSLGKIGEEVVSGTHTVSIRNFKIEEVEPEKFYATLTGDKQTVLPNLGNWQKNVTLTVVLASDGKFSANIGGGSIVVGGTDTFAQCTSVESTDGSEITLTLDVDNFNTYARVNVDSYEGTYIEIKSATATVRAPQGSPQGGAFDGWELFDHENSFTTGVNVAEDIATVSLKNSGTADWHIQYKSTVNLTEGKWYRISFDAKSTVARNILVSAQHDGNSDNVWTTYNSENSLFALGTDWASYECYFYMNTTDANANLKMSMGAVNGQTIASAHDISFKNVKLVEVADPLAGWSLYDDGSTHSKSFVKNYGAVDITLNDNGSEDWHIQYKKSVTLQQGKCYKISFDAKSTINRNIKFVAQHEGTPYTTYGSGIYALTSEWSSFATEFYMPSATDAGAFYKFCLGKIDEEITAEHTVSIRNIKIEEITATQISLMVDPGNASQYKGSASIDPAAYVADYVGKNLKVTVKVYGGGYFGGAIGGNSSDANAVNGWYSGSQNNHAAPGVYTWTQVIPNMTSGSISIDIWWNGANDAAYYDLQIEVVP